MVKELKVKQAASAMKFAEGYRDMNDDLTVKDGRMESLSSIAQ